MKIIIKIIDKIVLATGRGLLAYLDPTLSRDDVKKMDLDEVNTAINALK